VERTLIPVPSKALIISALDMRRWNSISIPKFRLLTWYLFMTATLPKRLSGEAEAQLYSVVLWEQAEYLSALAQRDILSGQLYGFRYMVGYVD
jgi:hypothetical protein